jgi:NADPH-dependent curcumin reductase CurA
MSESDRYVALSRYVLGGGLDASCFELRERPKPRPGQGQVLLQALALSADPYMRSRMTGQDTFFLPQYALGAPIESLGVARVVESRNPSYKEGDLVTGLVEWADYSVWNGHGKLDGGGLLLPVASSIPKISHALGVYGLNGLTALFGILYVARPKPGETLVVSGAAGGIGTIAGQIAKIMGARVVGIAGSAAKCAVLLQQLGFDDALDYRLPSFQSDLQTRVPNGADIYFDNVGGKLSQTVMWQMRRQARVIECGQISTYEDPSGGWQVDIRPIHAKGLRWESFTTAHFQELMPGATAQLIHWVEAGKLTVLETEYHGLQSAPQAMIGIMSGENIGKTVVNLTAAAA